MNCNRCGAQLEGQGPRCSLCHERDLKAASPAVLLPAGVEIAEVHLAALPGSAFPNPLTADQAAKAGWILLDREGNRQAVYSLSHRVKVYLKLVEPKTPTPAAKAGRYLAK